MSENSDFHQEVKDLKLSPTPIRWATEIRKALQGKRDCVVHDKGIQSYIEILLMDSADKDLARSVFSDALQRVTEAWNTAKPESQYYLASLLDLIAANTPAAGFIKVLAHIRQWGWFGKNKRPLHAHEKDLDLHLKALQVLARYYPIAPTTDKEIAYGFNSYLRVLEEHLASPLYEEYAGSRLVDLEILQVNDEKVLDATRANPAIVENLLPVILKPARLSHAGRDMAVLFLHSTIANSGFSNKTTAEIDEVFAKAARTCGARFEHQEITPAVQLRSGQKITFEFTDEELDKFARLYQEQQEWLGVGALLRAIYKNADAKKEFSRLYISRKDQGLQSLMLFEQELAQHQYEMRRGLKGVELIYLPTKLGIHIDLSPEAFNEVYHKVQSGDVPVLTELFEREDPAETVREFQQKLAMAASSSI